MELRSLSQQNVLVKTADGSILLVPNPKEIDACLKSNPGVNVVVTFAEARQKQSNRDILICDWPGEYERNDTPIIGLQPGCFIIALEGKYWLVTSDTALKSLDQDNEALNTVEGVLLWINDVAKEDVQEAISKLAPSYIVYCVDAEHEARLKDFSLAPLPSVSELSIKSSEMDGNVDQIKVQALLI